MTRRTRRTWRDASLAVSAVVASGGIVGCSSSPASGAAESLDASVDAALFDAPSSATGPDALSALDGNAGDARVSDAGATDFDAGDGGCPSDGGIPDDLACTGLYSDWATKTIAADALPYTPGLVFWSDGAVKSRWIHLPAGSQIDTTDMDNWVFPAGTKIWKQFALNGQIVETRLLWKDTSGWTYLDYLWSADGTSATRFDDGETNVNGTTYEIPSTSVCSQCHGGRLDVVLGVDFLGLGVAGAEGVTLASLAAQGRFTKAPPATAVVIPDDATRKAAAALGWLHVNCGSSCHNVHGNATATGLYTKLLAGQLYPADGGVAHVGALDPYTTAVDVPGRVMPLGVTYERIAPGDAAHSLIPLLALSRDDDGGFRPMPPLVSHVPDTVGEAAVSAWINALGDGGAD